MAKIKDEEKRSDVYGIITVLISLNLIVYLLFIASLFTHF